MGKKKYVVRTVYYVVVSQGKVAFLGSDFETVMERVKEGTVTECVHRISAVSYREAAYAIAESHYLLISEEVQENFKLLRGYKK